MLEGARPIAMQEAHRAARSDGGIDPDDLVQAVMTRLCERATELKRADEQGHFGQFVRRVARNLCLNELRAHRLRTGRARDYSRATDAELESRSIVGLDGRTPYRQQQAGERVLAISADGGPTQTRAESVVPPHCEVQTHQLPSVWARLAPMASRITW
jgi:RNA polymerase sigma factor (sigma-70 family)